MMSKTAHGFKQFTRLSKDVYGMESSDANEETTLTVASESQFASVSV